MNTDTGHIANQEVLEKVFPEMKADSKNLVEVQLSNLTKKMQEELTRIGMTRVSTRSRCPCGSGKRFKSCCMTKPSRPLDLTSEMCAGEE